ncbi:type 1 glutamine amidotransferase [Hydrogenophaga sp. 5NK40-0174]|uniref:type 1 glutamine amidotransferase n=1 Tax=Hydrogenophaga sp. 5NK40-0174 TaxID=3127649 RepID=UPI0031022A00
MLIGILECGQTSPDWIEEHGEMAAPFPPFLRTADASLDFTVYKAHRHELPAHPEGCDAWLITGSPSSVHERLPWQPALSDFLRAAALCRPVIGICFGHQLMHDALGGEVQRSDKGWGIGVQDYPLDVTPDWAPDDLPDDNTFRLIALHQDQVTTGAPGTKVLAGNGFCPFGITTIGDNVLTIQAHPEMTTRLARDIYESQRAEQGKEATDAAVQSLQTRIDSLPAAHWVLAFLRHRMVRLNDHSPSAY